MSDEAKQILKERMRAAYANGNKPTRAEVRAMLTERFSGILWAEDVKEPDDWQYSVQLQFCPAEPGKTWRVKRPGFAFNTPMQELMEFYGDTDDTDEA